MLPEPMTHPRSLAHAPFGWAPFGWAPFGYAPFGWAQDRRDRCARMGHPGGPFAARLKSCPDKSCPDESSPDEAVL